MADTGTAAALAANFEFSDERVRAANRDEAMFPDAAAFDIDRPNAKRDMALRSGIEFRGIQGVHSVKSMPLTFTPVPAAGLSASV
jgi:hypothetical protein